MKMRRLRIWNVTQLVTMPKELWKEERGRTVQAYDHVRRTHTRCSSMRRFRMDFHDLYTENIVSITTVIIQTCVVIVPPNECLAIMRAAVDVSAGSVFELQ